ncbi:hypothetical protein TEQG_04630 [Trichophyton equinum CBS 127.97]|uniref:Uncharacterized protein n=1 Tax=Trichophyton equinum (strain ATCC MYA-4606 / CBS 127.97) TaxID=559882 RepID=F2PUQ3_TRIEC|nr:hypothetical protein TEQG_04630 [Trichophyton equinum CBS 127.97]
MDYLSSICRNFTTFITLQNISRQKQKISTVCEAIPRNRLLRTMLSPPSTGRPQGNRQPLKRKVNKYQSLVPLTPETPSAGRKRRIVQKGKFGQSNGEAANSDDGVSSHVEAEQRPSKRLRVYLRPPKPPSQKSFHTSSCYDSELDGSTLIEDGQGSKAKVSSLSRDDLSTSASDTSSGSEDVESSVSLEDRQRVFDKATEVIKNKTHTPVLQTPRSKQHRRRNPSRLSCSAEVYRPSPKIVDKNLSKQIVRRDAHESDLSEEEIYDSKYSTKREIKRDLDIEFRMEKARRWAAAVEGPSGNWADAERDMYFRLAMRGFESVLPHSWKMDFMTLPDSLFNPANDHTAYISSRNEFRGMKYFNNLVTLGGRVRDRITCHLPPEKVIKQYLCTYLQWTLRDIDMQKRPRFTPPYSVYTLKPNQITRDAVNIMNSKLVAVAKDYQNAWRLTPSIESDNGTGDHFEACPQYQDRTFPVITGYLICGPVVVLMTLDSDPETFSTLDAKISGRLMSRFDFSEYGQDVWNALAIAIAAARMRKTIAQCEQEGTGDLMWMADSVPDSPDEDL